MLRLMQLVSPSPPVGLFTYSQGLETAVELGWFKPKLELAGSMPELVEPAMHVEAAEIGAGSPALAIASSRYESQYTRLFRS